MGTPLSGWVTRLIRDEGGQDLAEYGIALAVISASVAFVAIFIGFISFGLWDNGANAIDQAVSAS